MEPSPPNRRLLLKRKQRSQSPSSNPFLGIFTRSKSQIYVHHNRSGRARRDAAIKPVHRFGDLPNHHPRKPKSPDNADDGVPIKDLRARRVFSVGLARSTGPNIFRDKDGEDLERGLKSLGNYGKSDVGFSGNVDLCGSDGGCGVTVCENVEDFDGSGEKRADLTPLKEEDNEKGSGKNEVLLDVGVDQTKGSNSSSKMVVKLQTRRKVFKAPSSFSYRRLLPFLKDIAKDESRILKIEIVDAGFQHKFKTLNNEICNLDVDNVTSNLQSVMDCSNAAKCKNVIEYSDDGKPQHGEMHKVEVQSPSNLQDSDVVNNDVGRILGDRRLSNEKLEDDDENGVNDANGLMEECVQMTPPDADIFSKPEPDGWGENAEGECLETNSVCGHIFNGGISTNGVSNIKKSHQSPNQENGTISKTKLVLNPCSRLKLFKPLGSVSYRRLLPYLTSVETTNSCVSRIGDQAKAKSGLEGDQDPELLASSKEETPINGTKPESYLEKKLTENEEQNQTSPMVPPTYGSADNPCPNLSVRELSSTNDSSDREPSSVSFSNINDRPGALNMQTAGTAEPDSVVSSCHTKLEPQLSCNNVKSFEGEPSYSVVPSCSSVNHEIRPTDSTLEASLYEPDGNDQDCMDTDNVQLVRTVAMKQSSSKDEASDEPGNHIHGPRRGILKRNPRGCRGLCGCINCASFRLNAERAFEFSRNQMQDAEEVSLELIKELTGLRHMLEKSAANANDLTFIQLNRLQVEEACRKALETEKLAKERLSQMNEDLNIHCRTRSLHRPKVTFSGRYDEEKVIPPRQD